MGTLTLMAPSPEQVFISHRQQRWELGAGETFTFGRAESCTLCLDPADLGISRLAGSVEHESGVWWVLNRSATRPLTVVDELGIRTVVAPGRRLALAGPMSVVVEGSARRHALEVVGETGPAFAAVAQPGDALPTATAHEVVINDADRLALVALFSGYLEPFPRYDPHPRSYADAADAIGCPAPPWSSASNISATA